MSTCSVYKSGTGGIKLGTGSITNGAVTVTSYDRVDDSVASNVVERVTGVGRNVTVAITSSTHIGSVFQTRVLIDAATVLTLANANPFAT